MISTRIATLSLIVLAAATAHTCVAGIPGFLSRQHVDWNFIESVGGMKVHLEKGRLAVSCDVSGTKTITKKPTTVNSAMGVRKLVCTRVGGTLRIAVVTSVLEKGMTSACGSIDLSGYPAGSYAVVYLNPDGTTHPLGTVALP